MFIVTKNIYSNKILQIHEFFDLKVTINQFFCYYISNFLLIVTNFLIYSNFSNFSEQNIFRKIFHSRF